MKPVKVMAAAAALVFLTSCSAIEYGEPAEQTTEMRPPTEIIIPEETTDRDKYQLLPTEIVNEEFSFEAEAEGNCDCTTRTALDGYSGDGYIQLPEGMFTTFSVTVPSSQHYKVSFRICSAAAKLLLIVGGEETVIGDYGFEMPDGAAEGVYYISESVAFNKFSLNGIFLEKGENKLTLLTLSGTPYIDGFSVEAGKTVSDSYYNVSFTPADSEASTGAVRLMQYFQGIYGKKTLTGQYVTPGTNTEINAVLETTGRAPAIRASDLTVFQEGSPFYDPENPDLSLAEQWAKQGGLVSYSWTWYSPGENSHYLASAADFDISKVNSDSRLGEASLETVKSLYGDGTISEETYLLIRDIDRMAEKMKPLAEAGVTVLFRPLHEAGRGNYWWGTDEEGYKWLWRTMFERFSYHGLHNIIWVWNGENSLFYPGDGYVDIVSEDIYNSAMESGNIRFMDSGWYEAGRALALSECAFAPSPDKLYRDNAMWLWFAVWRGDYIINEDGSFSDRYISAKDLEYAYNHELYITLDELPEELSAR